jgi:uncharacterized protein
MIMLLTFFYTLRSLKLPVGTQEWLVLMEALVLNLNDSSLDHFYTIARSILIKSEAHFDAYDQAFLICFKGQESQIDLKKEILDWLNKSVGKRPPMPDIDPLTLQELRRQFLERMKEQMEEHHGGNRWIGTGGTSPFGHGGAHPSGIRIGGAGGGRMAVKVAEERRFKNYRHDRVLDTRQMKVALKRLRKLDRVGIEEELNIDKSIEETCKNAGEIELIFEAPKKNQSELLLLMDSGGSMDPYARLVESLFSAAHASTHFKAFKHFYFHNCIYAHVYKDIYQNKAISLDDIFHKYRKSFSVIIVGDACMNPYELYAPGGIINYWDHNPTPGISWLKKVKDHYSNVVWLNPEHEDYWSVHPTIEAISKLFPMYPLSIQGLTRAVDILRGRQIKRAS